MRKWVFMLLLGCLLPYMGYAGDINGKVTVLNKDGEKPLKSFEDAVVYIEGLETPAPPEPATMDQSKKRFDPRLLPVIKGQEIQFFNSDRLHHNVFSPHEEEPFDLGRYPKGEHRSVTLNVLGQHKVYCNIHQQMISDIYVVPNRYFGVTDKAGNFVITDVPEGEYTLKVWHIYEGTDEKSIRVADQPMEVNLTVTSQKRIRDITEHKNKIGRPYDQQDDRRY